MTDRVDSIRDKVKELAEFLREEYLDPKNFDGWPGLGVRPGVRPSVDGANLYFLGCLVDVQEFAWRAWSKARRFCEEIVPVTERKRLWHWISQHKIEEWKQKKKQYDLHWIGKRHEKVHEIASRLVRRFQGDPRCVWEGRSGGSVLEILESELKVGPSVARMMLGGLRDHGLVKMERSDFKPDKHVSRAMHLLGLSPSDRPADVVRAGRQLFEDPWSVDGALWTLARDWGIKGLDDFHEIYTAMQNWKALRSEVCPLVQRLQNELLPDADRKHWKLTYEESNHWRGLYVTPKIGPLVRAMEEENLWAWLGVGFDGKLAMAVEIGGKPGFFSASITREFRKHQLDEERHESSGLWGFRDWYRAWTVSPESLKSVDKLKILFGPRLKTVQDLVMNLNPASISTSDAF